VRPCLAMLAGGGSASATARVHYSVGTQEYVCFFVWEERVCLGPFQIFDRSYGCSSIYKNIGPSASPHADGLLATAPGCTLDYILSFTVVAPTHRHSM
jgi:hypothetical protein